MKIEPDFEVGEEVSEELKLLDLGRRSIQSLRQNLVAKVFEHDSNNTFNQFKDRVGEIFTFNYRKFQICLVLWQQVRREASFGRQLLT